MTRYITANTKTIEILDAKKAQENQKALLLENELAELGNQMDKVCWDTMSGIERVQNRKLRYRKTSILNNKMEKAYRTLERHTDKRNKLNKIITMHNKELETLMKKSNLALQQLQQLNDAVSAIPSFEV